MRRRLWFSVVGVVAVAAIVIGINMFADARLAYVHVDLTQSRIYTLSPGTRHILQGLKEPITLRLFYSRQLGSSVPVYGTYADHVREMLQEYAAVADGKIKLEFYDPEPFSDTEDHAMAYGLQGVPSIRPAPRSISAWPVPICWMTSAPSPSSSRSANASWNTT